MTDKPDVAALYDDTMPVHAGLKRIVDDGYATDEQRRIATAALAELTRLAAERDDCFAYNIDVGVLETLRSDLATANATIERLRAVLEPFAESAAYFEVFGIYGGVQVRHLRDARDALKSNTVEKP